MARHVPRGYFLDSHEIIDRYGQRPAPSRSRSPRRRSRRMSMRRPLRTVIGLTAVLLLGAGLVVQGCHDQTAMEAFGPDQASAVRRTLKASGGGTGSGSITAPAVGGAPALNCQISGGTYDPDDCTVRYANNTSVPLTATPSPGSAFK